MVKSEVPSPEEIALLEEEAARWVGTPWMDNSASPGVGVCCHRLVVAVYVGAGWLAAFDPPRATGGWARYANLSLMRTWLDSDEGRARFREVQIRQDGDLCLVKAGHVEHHLAIALPGNRYLHAPASGVEIVAGRPAFAAVLRGLWRPIRIGVA